jgi:sn-glycerol 3-phosphate transport system substrate-binding protein
MLAAACGGDDVDSAGGGDEGGGAGGGAADAANCPVDALDDADGPVEIDLWHGVVGLTATTIQQFADEYNASQDEVVVKVASQGNYEEQQKKYTDALRDPGTLPEIMLAEDTNTRFMIDSQAPIPAADCIAADPDAAATYDTLMPAVQAAYSVEGTLWPAAFGVSTPVIYYNRAHFEAAGLDPDSPPETLEDITAASEKLLASRSADNPRYRPFVYRTDSWWMEHLDTRAGDALVDQDNGRSGLATESRMLNQSTDEWTSWMQDMNTSGLMKPVAYSATFDAYLTVASQEASMLVETSTAATTVDALITGSLKAEDLGLTGGPDLSGLSFPDLDMDVGELPGFEDAGSGQIGGNAWYLIGAGKSPEEVAAAWDFIKYVLRTENQVLWTTQGSYLPVFEAAEQDPSLQAYFTDTRPGRWLATAFEGLSAVDPDFPGPVIGPYKEFRTAVRAALEEGLIGTTPLDDAMATADSTFQSALDAYALDVGG